MSWKREEEVISHFFQENQMRHGEIMGIINDQTLDPLLPQQLKEQILRSFQRPRAPSPRAVNQWFPRAASRESFLGAVTASTGECRPPIIPASRQASSP